MKQVLYLTQKSMAGFIKHNSTFNISKTLIKRSLTNFSSTQSSPVVTVREGKLRGTISNLLDGSNYYSFKGIPYAEPPVGKLRFKAPLPLKPWSGILDAIENGPICPQHRLFCQEKTKISEDCLFLNVYTRSLQPDSKIPVMVYIHGGGFLSGSGDTDVRGPEFLLQHDVVLVTMNYRLEAFGFLCLDIPEVPGNAGLRDQVVALHWVKNNIKQFGGDPDNVTIFGDSAGGASVTYHMISPMSTGLFHKAISQSGTILPEWTLQSKAKERAFKVGKYLGKDTDDPYELLNFLQSVPFNKLMAMTSKVVTPIEINQVMTIIFSPVVEKKFPSCDAFITENPLDMLLSGKIQRVPLIVGYTSSEGLLYVQNVMKSQRVRNQFPSYFVQPDLAEKISNEYLKVAVFGRRIKQFYFGNNENTPDDIEKLTDFITDIHFVYYIHKFASFYAEFSESLYMYRWNLVTDLNCIKDIIGLNTHKGACHGDDVFYIFKNAMNSDNYEKQQKLRDHVYMITKLWTDFAKTGNPTPDDRWNIKWKPYTKSSREYLRIDETLSMGKDDEKERIEFWNKLYIEAGLPAITKSHL